MVSIKISKADTKLPLICLLNEVAETIINTKSSFFKELGFNGLCLQHNSNVDLKYCNYNGSNIQTIKKVCPSSLTK